MSDTSDSKLSTDIKMLWEALFSETPEEALGSAELLPEYQELTKDQIKKIKKELSRRRLQANRDLESVNQILEELSRRNDSLTLVGGDVEETVDEIHLLSEKGEKLTKQLMEINKKISFLRALEKKTPDSNSSVV